MNEGSPTIAVIGGGVAGIAAADRLQQRGVQTTLIERSAVLGGDALGLRWKDPLLGHRTIDCGVSDFNLLTFHGYTDFLRRLEVDFQPIRQDAAFLSLKDGLRSTCMEKEGWRGDLAITRNEIHRFRVQAAQDLEQGLIPTEESCESYLYRRGYSAQFRWNFFAPRAIGVFFCDLSHFWQQPISLFLTFWKMHGLIGTVHGERMHVPGGMQLPFERFAKRFQEQGGKLLLGTQINHAQRSSSGIRMEVRTAGGDTRQLAFDGWILAGKPEDSALLLGPRSSHETEIFRIARTQNAEIVVHSDPDAVGAPARRLGSYNFLVPDQGLPRKPTITFYTNHLTRHDEGTPVFVSVHPWREPAPRHVIFRTQFSHVVGFRSEARLQELLSLSQGRLRTWFCGSWTAPPFLHENAFQSGVAVANAAHDSLRIDLRAAA